MKYIFLFFLVVGTQFSWAQNETYKIDDGTSQPASKADYLVGDIVFVPFKEQLYKSHFDKELMEHNHLSYEELRDSFQVALGVAIAEACDSNYTLVALGNHHSRLKQDREILHEALNYDYKAVPTVIKEEDAADEKFKKAFKKLKKPTQSKKKEGTYIENGQLVTHRSKEEKYMSVFLDDQDIITVFSASYNNGYFLSVNQFEFLVPVTVDPIQLQSGIYNRHLIVHYSFLNRKGNEMVGGKCVVEVPSTVRDLDQITGIYFTELAQQIAKSLPSPKNVPQIER